MCRTALLDKRQKHTVFIMQDARFALITQERK